MAYDVHTQEHHPEGDHHGHHIIPLSVLLKVFGGLLFLTVLTVLTATQMDLGALDVPVAIAIAGAKAALVVTFFMALKYDNRVNTLTFAVGSIFVVVFLVFTLFDTAFRGDIGTVDSMTVEDREREEELLRARDPGEAGLIVTPADYEAAAVGGADAVEDEETLGEEEDLEDQPVDLEGVQAPVPPAGAIDDNAVPRDDVPPTGEQD